MYARLLSSVSAIALDLRPHETPASASSHSGEPSRAQSGTRIGKTAPGRRLGRASVGAALVSTLVLLQATVPAAADSVTWTGLWTGPGTTKVPEIPTPAGTPRTSFTGYNGGTFNYTTATFSVGTSGNYSAQISTTAVTNTSWFLTGTFDPGTSPTTPIGNFFSGVFAGSTVPYTDTFSSLALTAGTNYSILLAYDSTSPTLVSTYNIALTGPGCITTTTKSCVVPPPPPSAASQSPPPPPPSVINGSQSTFTNGSYALQVPTVTFDGGNLKPTAALSVSQPVVVTDNGGTITPAGNTVTLGGAVTGSGNLTVFSRGSVILSGTVTNAGGLDVQQSSVTIASGGNVSTPMSVQNSGSVTVDNNGRITAPLNLSGTSTARLNGQVSAPVNLSGGSSAVLGSTGTLSGPMIVTNASAIIGGSATGPIAVVGGGSVTVAAGGNVSNVVSATGSTLTVAADATVSGPGVNLTGNSTASINGRVTAPVTISGGSSATIGTTGILNGTLAVLDGSAIVNGTTTAAILVTSGGSITVSAGASINTLSATGGTVNVSPNAIITGVVSLTGNTTTSLTGRIAAPVTLAGGGNLVVDAAIVAPLAIHAGSVTVDSTGSVGALTVDNGASAKINGLAGSVTIADGSTLSGGGTIQGPASLSGTLSPGNSPGILNFRSAVTLTGTSVYRAEIDGPTAGTGAGHHDQAVVQGAGFTAAGALAPVLRGIAGDATNSFTAALGQSFTIVRAEGGVSGSFTSVAQPTQGLSAGTRFDALYDATSVRLVVTPSRYAALPGTRNQQAVATALDTLRPAAGVRLDSGTTVGATFNSLYSLPQAGIPGALDQLSGKLHADTLEADLTNRRLFGQAIEGRLAVRRFGGGALAAAPASNIQFAYGNGAPQGQAGARDDLLAAADNGAATTGTPNSGTPNSGTPNSGTPNSVWGQPLMAYARISSDGNAAGAKERIGGFMAGVDHDYDRGLSAGVALGFLTNRVNSQAGLGFGHADSYQATLYGTWDFGGPYLEGAVGYGYSHYDTERSVGFSGTTQTVKGKTRGNDFSASLMAGRPLTLGDGVGKQTWLEPRFGFRLNHITRDGFTEEGTTGLQVGSASWNSVRSSIGLRAGTQLTLGGWKLEPTASLAWEHDFADVAPTSTNRLGGVAFTAASSRVGRDTAAIGAGIGIQLGDGLTAVAGVQSQLRSHETVNAVTIGLKWRF